MMDELATFMAIVRWGSMSRAATELHRSQPAISQRLRMLEQNYGMPLLQRTNRGVQLTPAGEILATYARRMLSLDQSLQEELDALRTAEPQPVLIGATSVIGGYALPCTVYLFQQKHPTARIQLVIGKRAEIMQKLHDGILGVAVVEGAPAGSPDETAEGWHSVVVSEEDLVLITPVNGPLGERAVYKLEDLRQAPLILREPWSGTRQIVEQGLLAHGLRTGDLNIAMEMSSLDAIKTSVAQGHGVALVSKWAVRVEARMGTVRIAPLEGISFNSRWTLMYAHKSNTASLNRALIRTLGSPAERGFC